MYALEDGVTRQFEARHFSKLGFCFIKASNANLSAKTIAFSCSGVRAQTTPIVVSGSFRSRIAANGDATRSCAGILGSFELTQVISADPNISDRNWASASGVARSPEVSVRPEIGSMPVLVYRMLNTEKPRPKTNRAIEI